MLIPFLSHTPVWSAHHPLSSRLVFTQLFCAVFWLMIALLVSWLFAIFIKHSSSTRCPFPQQQCCDNVDEIIGKACLMAVQHLIAIMIAWMSSISGIMLYLPTAVGFQEYLVFPIYYSLFSLTMIGPVAAAVQQLARVFCHSTPSLPPLCCLSGLMDTWLQQSFTTLSLSRLPSPSPHTIEAHQSI